MGGRFPKILTPAIWDTPVGHWEGDTFVGRNDWFQRQGMGRSVRESATSTTRLTERYRRLNHDTLEQQIIIEDPKVYTKPWVSPPKLHKLEPGWEIAGVVLRSGRKQEL